MNNNEQHPDLLNTYIDTALCSSIYALNSAINTTTKVSPGAFVFQRDMILPITCITNWELIRNKKQLRIQHNNFLENKRRRPFSYTVNNKVFGLKFPENPRKNVL